jgi:hypothetical protein
MASHVARSSLAAVVVLAGLVLCVGAQGQPPGKAPKKLTNAQIIAKLQSVNDVMRKANHDYNGNRVRAMQEVNRAQKALGAKNVNKDLGASRPAEDQKLSDAQLREGRKRLDALLGQLGTPRAKTPRARAVNHIKSAIQHIDIALTIN